MHGDELADPFGLASTPSAYVSRSSAERALNALDEALANDRVPALIGPPGLGKTLLLQRVAARLDDHIAPIYVPFSTLSLPEFCSFVLGLVEEPVTDDPEEALREILYELRRQRATLQLLIDDVTMMPLETAQQLAEWSESSKGTLQLILAGIEPPGGSPVFDAFGERLRRIRLDEEMNLAETRDYIERRLAIASAPQSIRDAFDEVVIEELYEVSKGNPRAVNVAAQSIVRAASPNDAPRLEDVYDPRAYDIEIEEPEPTDEYDDSPNAYADDSDATIFGDPAEESDEVEIEEPVFDADEVSPATAERDATFVSRDPAEYDCSYRVVRGRKVEGENGELGDFEGRSTIERLPTQAAAIAAEMDALEGPDTDDARTPEPLVESSDPARPSVAKNLLALGDAITRRPLTLVGSLVGAIAIGLAIGSLAGPATVSEPKTKVSPPVTTPSETEPAAAPPTVAKHSIAINATPWALIEVDGVELGETPIAGLEITPGLHTIRAYFPNGAIQERIVDVDEQTQAVTF